MNRDPCEKCGKRPGKARGMCGRCYDAWHRAAPRPLPPITEPRTGGRGRASAQIPVGPLDAAIRATGQPLTRLLGPTDRRAIYRARRSRRISEWIADDIAVTALGTTLHEIYGPKTRGA